MEYVKSMSDRVLRVFRRYLPSFLIIEKILERAEFAPSGLSVNLRSVEGPKRPHISLDSSKMTADVLRKFA